MHPQHLHTYDRNWKDHIWSLKHVYPALGCPPLYGTKFTIWLVKKQLDEAWLLPHSTLIEVDAWNK